MAALIRKVEEGIRGLLSKKWFVSELIDNSNKHENQDGFAFSCWLKYCNVNFQVDKHLSVYVKHGIKSFTYEEAINFVLFASITQQQRQGVEIPIIELYLDLKRLMCSIDATVELPEEMENKILDVVANLNVAIDPKSGFFNPTPEMIDFSIYVLLMEIISSPNSDIISLLNGMDDLVFFSERLELYMQNYQNPLMN